MTITNTFKFFTPNGDCRRVTFYTVPDFDTVSKLIDGFSDTKSSDRRQMSYVDSEGDHIIIESSQDLSEAAKDATESGKKTIKIQIHHQVTKGGNKASARRQRSCRVGGPFSLGPRYYHHIFGNPFHTRVDVLDSVDELFDALFSQCSASTSTGGVRSCDDKKDKSEEKDTTKQASSPQPKQEDVSTSNDTSRDVVANIDEIQKEEPPTITTTSSDFVHVDVQPNNDDSERQRAPASAATDQAEATKGSSNHEDDDGVAIESVDYDAKVRLLGEMGFDIPCDVAKEMISEMGGRMDLIVRALVANSK